jgi:hypothetical protein
MTAIINGDSPSVTFSDGTTQSTAFKGSALAASPYTTSLGASTLVNNTGTSNTAVGNSALANNTTASQNTAVGYQAGYTNTTGTNNIFIGMQSGYSANADYNSFVGMYAGYTNTSGSNNAALGYTSLFKNTTGGTNSAVGVGALFNNTTASNNTAVGYQAGYSVTTGTRNIYVGRQAGQNSTGNYCVFVGDQAGLGTTGDANTFVGVGSGYLVTSGTNNTILGVYNGNQGGLDIRTASNYIVLSDGNGNPRVISDGSGQVMIGATSVLGAKLTIKNAGNGMSIWNNNGTSGYFDQIYFYNNAGNAIVGYINRVNDSSVQYVTSSDYRLKEDIAPMTGALATVSQLKPVTYKWKVDGTDGQGFIAHELQELVPECVTGEKDAVDADGKPVYQGIDTSFLVATLTAAIQELKAEFDAYKATHP